MDNIFTALLFILLAGIVILPAALDHRRFLKEQASGRPMPAPVIPPLSRKEWLKRLRRIFFALFPLCSLIAIGEWITFSPSEGGAAAIAIEVLLVLLFVLSAPAMLLGLIGLGFPRARRMCLTLLSAVAMLFLCGFFWGWVGSRIRNRALHAFTERSKPLVSAIEAYQKDQGHSPAKLQELVPAYLSAIPGTGLGICPEYRYIVRDADHGLQKWQLSIIVHEPFGYSELIYDPLNEVQPYSDGILRIRDWTYTW